MAPSSPSRRPDTGFTLIELLVVIVVAMLLMAGFTGFYLSEQRAMKHHQMEVQLSQGLRAALDQISRDGRSARKDFTGTATFLAAAAASIEFQIHANRDRTHKS